MELDLGIEKSSRYDVIFICKYGPEIYMALYESLELSSNTVENIESIYTTLALFAVELACEETVLELLRLVLSLQDLALTSNQISLALKYNLHSVSASLLVLIAYICNITSLSEYANKVLIFISYLFFHRVAYVMSSLILYFRSWKLDNKKHRTFCQNSSRIMTTMVLPKSHHIYYSIRP